MDADDISPPHSVTLHRMVWHPDCYHHGELTSSGAFPSSDLKAGKFVSVDRHDLFDASIAAARAQQQQERADGTTHFREEARIIDLPCKSVRGIVDRSGATPLQVTSEPEDENPAHCGIRNSSGHYGKSYINEIRAKLMLVRTREWVLSIKA